jgi:hypothetical protein
MRCIIRRHWLVAKVGPLLNTNFTRAPLSDTPTATHISLDFRGALPLSLVDIAAVSFRYTTYYPRHGINSYKSHLFRTRRNKQSTTIGCDQ